MGQDWEGRGFDVVSFFPDPDDGYTGDFEVDYQDTLADFWQITDQVKPVAIVSFGVGNGPWKIDINARNLTNWIPDSEPPFLPDPNPPDDTVPIGYVRYATLPMEEIAGRVNALDLPGIGPDGAWVDWWNYPGRSVCEYRAYHGMWYRDMRSGGCGNEICLMTGFIHVKPDVPVESGTLAAEETLRVVIEALDELIPSPTPTQTPTITSIPTVTPTGIVKLAIMKKEGANDTNLYYYNSLEPGDYSYWQAKTRNPSPFARDLWVVPVGNDAIGVAP